MTAPMAPDRVVPLGALITVLAVAAVVAGTAGTIAAGPAIGITVGLVAPLVAVAGLAWLTRNRT